jgi:magnesium-transporting ATPase (P-type)
MAMLIFFVNMCEPYMDRESDESLMLDGEFTPSLKNSLMFIFQWWLNASVIFVNYSGRPFLEDISENRKLQGLLAFNFIACTMCVYDSNTELKEMLELVPFPNEEFQNTVMKCLMADLAVCYSIEKLMKFLYLRTFHE